MAARKRPTKRQLLAFVAQVASATKDGECAVCYCSEDDNQECPDHELFDMPNDDAVETLHHFIEMARELCPLAGVAGNQRSGPDSRRWSAESQED